MKKESKDKPVTQSEFKNFSESVFPKTVDRIDERMDRFDKRMDRLDSKIDGVAMGVLRMQDRVTRIEDTMATKQDVNLILDRIDFYAKKNRDIDAEQGFQAVHLKELQETSKQHEARITSLESSELNR